tara:strand:- start:12240 stop:12518 length:279 start_codon:yes stop_codon:yes gene_type:complete
MADEPLVINQFKWCIKSNVDGGSWLSQHGEWCEKESAGFWTDDDHKMAAPFYANDADTARTARWVPIYDYMRHMSEFDDLGNYKNFKRKIKK